MRDEAADVRVEAVKALACFQRGLDPWIPRIFEVVDRESEPRIRTAMTYALYEIRPPKCSNQALASLIAALASRHDDVRLQAAWLIGTLGPDAVPAVPDLIKLMSQPIDSSKVGRGKAHPAGWDPAWAAAHGLGKIAPRTPVAGEVIEALIAVVRTGHPYRRVAAAQALGDFGPAAVAAIPALIDVFKKSAVTKADLADGAEIATALSKIAPGTPLADEAISCLIEALKAESEYARQQAINALLPFGQKAVVAIPRLRVLVDDRHAAVRVAAANAIVALEAHDQPPAQDKPAAKTR